MEVDDKIDTIYKFVAAYEVNKYSILRDGGMLPSVEEFMREYCKELSTPKNQSIKQAIKHNKKRDQAIKLKSRN